MPTVFPKMSTSLTPLDHHSSWVQGRGTKESSFLACSARYCNLLKPSGIYSIINYRVFIDVMNAPVGGIPSLDL